nr:hypothetical protein [uncultured Campylobacter sp.]
MQHANAEPAVKFENPSAFLLNSIAADIFAGRAALNFSAKFNARRGLKALKTITREISARDLTPRRAFNIPRRICARQNFTRRHDLGSCALSLYGRVKLTILRSAYV